MVLFYPFPCSRPFFSRVFQANRILLEERIWRTLDITQQEEASMGEGALSEMEELRRGLQPLKFHMDNKHIQKSRWANLPFFSCSKSGFSIWFLTSQVACFGDPCNVMSIRLVILCTCTSNLCANRFLRWIGKDGKTPMMRKKERVMHGIWMVRIPSCIFAWILLGILEANNTTTELCCWENARFRWHEFWWHGRRRVRLGWWGRTGVGFMGNSWGIRGDSWRIHGKILWWLVGSECCGNFFHPWKLWFVEELPDLDPAEQPLVGDPKPGRLVDSQNRSPSAWLFAQGQGGGAAAEAGPGVGVLVITRVFPKKPWCCFLFPWGCFQLIKFLIPKTSRSSFASNPPEDLLVETASRSLMESRKWTQTPWTDAMEG